MNDTLITNTNSIGSHLSLEPINEEKTPPVFSSDRKGNIDSKRDEEYNIDNLNHLSIKAPPSNDMNKRKMKIVSPYFGTPHENRAKKINVASRQGSRHGSKINKDA